MASLGANSQTVRPVSTDDDGQVHVVENIRYYDITGRTEGDLLNGMVRLGPSWNGERYFGLTRTDVRYTYWKTPKPTGCDLTEIQVYLEVTVTLPRWQPMSGTPFQLERSWRSFDYALRQHELGHQRLAVEEAEMIRRSLASLRTASCNAIDAQARSQASRIRETYQSLHHDYDHHTDHGRTQGAVWPMRSRVGN